MHEDEEVDEEVDKEVEQEEDEEEVDEEMDEEADEEVDEVDASYTHHTHIKHTTQTKMIKPRHGK